MTTNADENKDSGFKWLGDFANNLVMAGTQVYTAKYTKPEQTYITTQGSGGLKLGDTEISTSTMLWIGGGAVGLLVFTGILKKVLG